MFYDYIVLLEINFLFRIIIRVIRASKSLQLIFKFLQKKIVIMEFVIEFNQYQEKELITSKRTQSTNINDHVNNK